MKMYSGSDSTESQNYTQWALNPTAYQNVSGENVDWAALAQQWIIMKEAGPPVPEQAVPSAIMNKLRKDNLNEGGEAPMDVENEKEDDQPEVPWGENVAVAGGDNWNWNQQSQWGWSNTWAPAGVPPPNTIKPPLLPTPAYNQYNTVPDVQSENTSFGGYSSVSQNDYTSGYWTAAGSSKMKQHNKRYTKVNVPRPPPAPEPIALDAAKRKQLPAWIREGLEKMERDKQRQLEKEREKQEKEEQDDKVKLSEKDALDIIKSTVKEQQRGKFESDVDDYSDDEKNTKNTYVAEPAPLTQEELMLKVRRTMTEILLNVTNREIRSVCKEELQRYVKKLKASDDRVSAPSGANLSNKLGLGMYGDSSSSGDENEEEPQQEFHDSDAELKDLIRKKKAEFSKTEREIEDRLAEAEGHTGEDSRPATPEVTDNDTQVDAKTQGRSKARFNNSNNEHTPPPKQVQLKRKSYKSSSSSSQSDTDSDKKSSHNYKSKRRRRSDSSNSRRSRSSSSEYKKSKHRDEVHGSKSSSSQSRRSRSKSPRNRRSRSRSKSYRRNRYSRRSHSRSRSRQSNSRSRRSSSRSHYKPSRSRRSRSRSRSYSRSHKRSRSRRRSNSSHRSHRKRRSMSSGSTRGKRSHRH